MTSEEVNALPERVRRYIHDLETNADPAGMVQENTCLRENILALTARVQELEGKLRWADIVARNQGGIERGKL